MNSRKKFGPEKIRQNKSLIVCIVIANILSMYSLCVNIMIITFKPLL